MTVGSATGVRYAEVKVNSICGMLVFPDTFTWPAGITTDKPSTFNTKSGNWNGRDYTAAEFTLLESAGYRDGSSMSYVGSRGYYWSSTPESYERSYYLYFHSGNVYTAYDDSRSCGSSVRLVSAANN